MNAKVLKSLFISILLLLLVILLIDRGVIVQKETGSHPLGLLAYIKGGDLWIKELPDGQTQRLTTDGHNARPSWSPSGQWVAYVKDGELWVARSSGTEARALSTGTKVNTFAWSPSGQWVAYVKDGELWVARSSGADARVLSSGAKVETLAWAPSSEWLAYLKDGELWVVQPSSGNTRALSPGTKVETWAWAPVAATLAYVTRTGSLYLASAAEWREREVVAAADGQELRRSFFSMAWSPKGQWLAYVREEVMKEKEPPDNRYAK